MTDKELLELAAKAAGYEDLKKNMQGFYRVIGEHEDGLLCMAEWNPLTDDGDALRLAVKLGIELEFYDGFEEVFATENTIEAISQTEPYKNDPYAATRRAIVRAAAEIGKTIGETK